MLRELNRRRCNTPPDSLADSRIQDVDEVTADHIQEQEEEQRRLNNERFDAMHNELWREWFGENYNLAQFAAESAGSLPPVPTGSAGSLPPVQTWSSDLRSVPTGSGDLDRVRSRSPEKPLRHLLLTTEELEQMEDQLLNFEMMFRSMLFTAETT